MPTESEVFTVTALSVLRGGRSTTDVPFDFEETISPASINFS
jgi:hypothetical protein